MRKFFLAALLLCVAGAFAQDQPSSVADAAKQKPQKKARRVITNDDIPSKPEPEPAAQESKKDDAAEPVADETAKTDAEKSAAPDNSDPVNSAQNKVDGIKVRLDSVQQQIAETEKKMDSATDDQVRDALRSARDGKKEFAEDLTKQLAEAEKELETAKAASQKPAEPANASTSSQPPLS